MIFIYFADLMEVTVFQMNVNLIILLVCSFLLITLTGCCCAMTDLLDGYDSGTWDNGYDYYDSGADDYDYNETDYYDYS